MIKKILKHLLPYQVREYVSIMKNKSVALKEIQQTQKYNFIINEKKRGNNKITVIFIIYMPSTWNALKAVFEYMQKNKEFNVFILAHPILNNEKIVTNSVFESFFNLYGNVVINAFNNGLWFDIKTLNPDYVFYTRPYNYEYYPEYRNYNVRKYAKCCWITYGYFLENKYDHNFNFVANYDFLQNCSFIFASNSYDEKILQQRFNLVKKKTDLQYPFIKALGLPKFELLQNPKTSTSEFKEITILWTPRWTSSVKKNNNQSTFLKYINNFINYAKNHKNLQFIMRPHPLMFSHYKKYKLIENDYDTKLKKKFSDIGNIFLDETVNYIDSIMKAEIIITDYTALLADYIYCNKKVLYTDSDSTFNYIGKAIASSCYKVRSWNKIEKMITNLLQGDDYLANKRLYVKQHFLMADKKSSSEKISNVLKQTL